MVMKALEPIWGSKPETASRLRGRIEAVLDWATVRNHRQGDNPARWRGHLDKLLPARSKVRAVKHHPALPYEQVSNFVGGLRGRDGISARALEFTILTAARSGEVLGMLWDEVDLGKKVWTVPGARMKAGRDYRVPLCDDAVAILKQVSAIRQNDQVFPAGRRAGLSSMALDMTLRRMGCNDITVHGFRSTFRDWAAERQISPEKSLKRHLHMLSATRSKQPIAAATYSEATAVDG